MPDPKLLAGPILRRVEKNKVSVWIALSEDVLRVNLKIYASDRVKDESGNDASLFSTTQPELPLEEDLAPVIKFGRHLYMAVVTAVLPSPGLQADQVYSYNVIVDKEDEPLQEDLKTFGLLREKTGAERPREPLGYAKNQLPTFVLPSNIPTRLILAQGSCRKMHGIGLDALANLDDVIKQSVEDVDADTTTNPRPQQLFLTGDQIYADDVPGLALFYASNVSGALGSLVGEEKVQIQDADSGSATEHVVDTYDIPPFLRSHLIATKAGFTSSAADSHLISFEEFCGIYLNYWSLHSWNDNFWNIIKEDILNDKAKLETAVNSFLDGDPVGDNGLVTILRDVEAIGASVRSLVFTEEMNAIIADYPSGEKFQKWRKDIGITLKKQLRAIKEFEQKLPKISRVLANVATYMIFDDHEITDDWNISQRWRNQVLSKPLGRDIIRNGLMAYTIFQDWGNVPAAYQAIYDVDPPVNPPPRANLILLIQEYARRIAAGSELETLRAEVINPIENLLGMGSSTNVVKWHYDVPSGPTQTYVLDTRTQRTFESLNSPPGLIGEDALREQTPNTIPDGSAPFVFVVSPAPVLGLSSFEELIQPAAASVMGLASKAPNPGLIGGLLEFDYEAWGFQTAAFEGLLDRLNTYEKVILLSGDVHYGFSAYLDYWKGSAASPSSRIIQLTASACKNMWLDNIHLFKSGIIQRILTGFGGKLEKVGWKDKVLTTSGVVSARNRLRLKKATAVVPVAGWESGATVSAAPDFRWRLSIAHDEEAPTSDNITTDIDLNDANALKEGYKKIVVRHQKFFETRIGRRIVWPSNVSLIRFEQESEGAPLKLRHEFLTEGKKPKMKHIIPLQASGDELNAPSLG
ncbi:MAG: hypothetical protein R2828_21425 [Saprospiraceae bacterium]